MSKIFKHQTKHLVSLIVLLTGTSYMFPATPK